MFVSERPTSKILCRSRPQLAAFPCCGRNVVRFSWSIFCTSFTSTSPVESGAGLNSFATISHWARLVSFCNTFSFTFSIPSRVFLRHVFRVCSFFLQCSPYFLSSRVPNLFQCRTSPLAQSDTNEDLVVWSVFCVHFVLPHPRVQINHTSHQ